MKIVLPSQTATRAQRRSPVMALLCALVASLAVLTLPATAAINPPPQLPDGTTVVPYGSTWQYHRAATEPPIQWQYSATDLKWPSGKAPLGYGSTGLGTTFQAMSPQPRITYFRKTFVIDNSQGSLDQGATFTTWADDGVVVYVNGHEIGRQRVADKGYPGLSWSLSESTVSTATAKASPVTFKVPASYLRDGSNVISAMVLVGYRTTPNISFDGQLVAGGGGTAPAVGRPDPNLKLTWSDEFSTTSLNPDNWNAYNLSTYGEAGGSEHCLMNRPENLKVASGALQLIARREATPIKCGNDPRYPNGRDYTSGHVYSAGKVTFTYGRIEMRAKLPTAQGSSQGMWPAFWLRPVDGGLGEIDILEGLGSNSASDYRAGVVEQTVHRDYGETPSSGYRALMPNGARMDTAYHKYAVEWTATEIRWYIDDVLTRKVNTSNLSWYNDAFVGRQYFIRLNLAVGGTWPGMVEASTAMPAYMLVDYVRLYQ